MEYGATSTLTAAILPAEAAQAVTWTTSDSAVATVSSGGLVTTVGAGVATITATSTVNASLSDACTVTVTEPAKKASWTMMYYGDADNDFESYLIADIQEMKSSLRADADINVIVLFDRVSGYSTDTAVFGSNFTDTRLYRVLPDDILRISGSTQMPSITTSSTSELNMGSAATLASFLNFCKANYPADNYALFLSNHGGGARSRSLPPADPADIRKEVCYDETSADDCLYNAEITDALSNAHSVDLLVYDACLMGTIEAAYQYRPGTGDFSADYIAASAPSVWGYGLPYDLVFGRIRTGGGSNGTTDTTVGGLEAYLDAATMTPVQFGGLIVEEQRDDTSSYSDQSFALYDLSRAANVKTAVDALAVALASASEKADAETIRGSLSAPGTVHYFDASDEVSWIVFPYFDLYSLSARIAASASFSSGIKTLASTVASETATMVLYSFGGSSYSGFTAGSHGISIFFPDGDRLYADYPMWAYQWWYNPIDTTTLGPDMLYGKIDFCDDGRTAGDGVVQNWFELMDSWFDASNTAGNEFNGVLW